MPTLPAVALLPLLLLPSVAGALDRPVVDVRREPVTGPCYVADRLLVRLEPEAARVALLARAGAAVPAGARSARIGVATLDAALDGLGLRFEPEFRGEPLPVAGAPVGELARFHIVHLPEGLGLESTMARLRGLPEVRSAEPIAVLPVCAVPGDSLWSESWWYAQASGHDVSAVAAWDVTTGDSAVVVGVLDTGVIPYHPDLGGTVAGLPGQVWTNRAEQAGLDGVDDDGNGYVDDVHGWDFVALAGVPSGQLPAEDYLDEDADPNDYAGHGTMVAGLAGALTDNAVGVAGMAWQVRLMPLRIGWAEVTSPLGYVDMSYVARALRYATRMGAHVVNCSFQSLEQSDLTAALDDAERAGVVVVSASGNNYGPSDIAERDEVVAVAATDASDVVPYWATRGDWVDLSAPGAGITSTFRTRLLTLPDDSLGYRQPGYGTLNGTSFSAPLVAGTAALLEAQRRALGLRRLPPQGVLLRLRETADDIAAYNTGTGYGTGRLNAYRALTDRTTSLAWRAGARTVGACVPIPLRGPARKLAWVTEDSRLLVQDWPTGDTLTLVALPGAPVGHPAAADLGGGHGVGLFVGTTNGWLAGYDTTGAVLAGFPQRPGPLASGPALGDLDGDGVLEVVCGSASGYVRAWRADGTVVPGFGVETDGWPIASPVALSDLDGLPGVEIVAATAAGNVFAFRGDGTPLWEAPVTVEPGPAAPVVAGVGGEPVVLVASGPMLRGLRADGTVRTSWPLPGTAAFDPALADLDHDGSDEVVLVVGSPYRLAALDSSGAPPAGLGWPAALAAAPQGAPVLGHLQGDGRPGAVVMTLGGLAAFTDGGQAIAAFPKPGRAATAPTLADLTGEGATRIAVGSALDSLLYVYDAGAGSGHATPQPWPTARGNFARTGSHLYLSEDALAPGAVADLAAAGVEGGFVRLTWTAPGDDGAIGRATAYELRFTGVAAETASVDGGTAAGGLPAPDPAGGAQGVTLPVADPGDTTWYWLYALDEAGNRSRCSNVCGFTGPEAPAGFRLAVGRRPSPAPVRLDWEGCGAVCIRVHDVSGRSVRRLGLGAGWSGSVEWDGRDEGGNLVPAGLYFARLTGGSLHAQTRIVLLP